MFKFKEKNEKNYHKKAFKFRINSLWIDTSFTDLLRLVCFNKRIIRYLSYFEGYLIILKLIKILLLLDLKDAISTNQNKWFGLNLIRVNQF